MHQEQAVELPYGRTLRVGQLWRSNDPRRFRIVRVLTIGDKGAAVENTVTGVVSALSFGAFTIGPRGFSLEKE